MLSRMPAKPSTRTKLKTAMAGATETKTKRLAFISGSSCVPLEFGDVEVSVHLFHVFVELGEYLLHLIGCCRLLRNGGCGFCLFFSFLFFFFLKPGAGMVR